MKPLGMQNSTFLFIARLPTIASIVPFNVKFGAFKNPVDAVCPLACWTDVSRIVVSTCTTPNLLFLEAVNMSHTMGRYNHPDRKADHLPLSSAEIKDDWSCTSPPT